MDTDFPEGKRFSHVYLERGEPRADSARARRRVSSTLLDIRDGASSGLTGLIQRELGIELPSTGYGTHWSNYFEKCEMRDFLDTITLAYQFFTKAAGQLLPPHGFATSIAFS
jgi:hypothetical protein